MATQKKTRSFQKIDNKLYRVSGAVRRSATTGKYVVDDPSRTAVRETTGKLVSTRYGN